MHISQKIPEGRPGWRVSISGTGKYAHDTVPCVPCGEKARERFLHVANGGIQLRVTPPPPPLGLGMVGTDAVPWEGEELTRTAHETFDRRTSAVTSRQHSGLVWCALHALQGTPMREERTAGLHCTE